MSKATAGSERRAWVWFVGVTAVWLLTYFAARGLLKRGDMETWLRVTVALVPVVPFALFLVTVIRGIRSLDEMQRRMHLEALAVAYPLVMLLLMTLGLLQRAVELPFEDWSYLHVWYFLPLFYFLGLALAARRYQ